MSGKSKLGASILSASTALAVQPLLAQDEFTIEEIIVTAQKREQNLQSTPLTLNVFSGEKVEKAQITSVQDVAASTPGLSIDAFPRTQPRPFIRGVGSSDTGAGGDQSTAVFVDGVYMSRPAFLAFDSFDVERLEVLKGPQGTLWGKNVVGGLLHIITKKPTDEFDIRIQGTGGNEGIRNGNAMINAPLIEDKLLSRLVISSRHNDGFAKNLNTGNKLFDEQRLSARTHFLLQASDDLELGLSFNYADENNGGSARNIHDGNVAGLSADPDGDNRKTRGEIDGFEERETWGVTVTADLSTEIGEVNIISNHKQLDYAFNEDFDGDNILTVLASSLAEGDPLQIQRGGSESTESSSLEVRFASNSDSDLFWQLGAYYEAADIDQVALTGALSGLCAAAGAGGAQAYATGIAAAFGFGAAAAGYGAGVASGCSAGDDLTTPATVQRFHQVVSTESLAIFGELSYDLTDIYTLTGGVRYSQDEKDYEVDSLGSFMDVQLTAAGSPTGYDRVSASDDWDAVTWRATLDAQFTEDLFGYATVSTGYKAGGFQSGPLTQEEARDSFDPEFVTNYEIGLKSELLDGRLRLNATTFFMQQEDLQVRQVEGTRNVTQNAGEAEIRGVELEALALLLGNFSADLKYTYLDAEFTEFVDDGDDFSGNSLSRAPEHSVTVNLAYTIENPFGAGGEMSLESDYAWNDDRFEDNSNEPPEIIDDYGLLDARIVYELANWQLSIWGKNLEDKEYETHYVNFGSNSFVVFGEPRTFGVTMTWNFK
ncbi:TonB-dependent receptor [Exilibacterium tricleocarpae]|uniref:TonB-dependent receptor n=1 Tax=Exilibacterium tricleocarpae TaxID=2591008 RepID=A0A545ST57_9GAMM|nr:TonB-dependent receptor [Exilibacterium tricleocarpae]TQV68147.1 TonB-dependent receptor [Exilibacterium tricleocarpae]